jgi:hypothetical protein
LLVFLFGFVSELIPNLAQIGSKSSKIAYTRIDEVFLTEFVEVKLKMRGNIFIKLAIISAVLVALMSSTIVFAGYPGPDPDTDNDYDKWGHGSYVTSAMNAYYYTEHLYCMEDYYSYRYNATSAYNGDMYYCWFADEEYWEGTTNETGLEDTKYEICTLVASYTRSNFIYNGEQYYQLDALAVRETY